MNLDTRQEKTLTGLVFRLFQISELMSPWSYRNYLDQFTTQEINGSALWLVSVVLGDSVTVASWDARVRACMLLVGVMGWGAGLSWGATRESVNRKKDTGKLMRWSAGEFFFFSFYVGLTGLVRLGFVFFCSPAVNSGSLKIPFLWLVVWLLRLNCCDSWKMAL